MVTAKTTIVLRGSSVLKRHDYVLIKISSNIIYESKMERCNTPIVLSSELVLMNLTLKLAERLSWVLKDEAIRKTMSFKREPL